MREDPARNDPSTVSAAYRHMQPQWTKVSTLLGGTAAMRAAGELYLPKYEHESPKNYQARLQGTTLLNMTEQILESWVGRPFSDPVQIDDDVPEDVEAMLDDVDMQGNSVHVFARRWYRTGLAKCLGHVIVDFPYVPEGERTLADDRRDGLRPYWCLIAPEDLIAASFVVEAGREVLTHVRVREFETQRDGFTERHVQRIRVFDRFAATPAEKAYVTVTVYELKKLDRKKEKWEIVQPARRIDLDEIPVVTFYADRETFMVGKAPVSDLADKNIEHWQSSSDQRNVLSVARFPILAQAGASPDGIIGGSTVVIGPKKLLSTASEQGKFYYVEHSGAAINAGRQDLQDIQEQMSHYGADFLRKRPGNETATARAIDSAEATSPLQDVTHRFNDALARAMALTAKWLRRESVGTITVATEFGPEQTDAADFAALAAARTARDISRRRYTAELKRRGTLDDDYDFDEDVKLLEKEAQDFGTEGAPTDGRPIDEAQ